MDAVERIYSYCRLHFSCRGNEFNNRAFQWTEPTVYNVLYGDNAGTNKIILKSIMS